MEDTTKHEILKAIGKLEGRFDGLETRFDGLETRFDVLDSRLDRTEGELMEAIHDLADDVQGLNDRMELAETNIGHIKSEMVTKDYLDRKIDCLRGDLVALSRKSNTKLSALVEQLVLDGTLKRQVADRILALEPFPVA